MPSVQSYDSNFVRADAFKVEDVVVLVLFAYRKTDVEIQLDFDKN